jgi:phage shock protein C
MKKLYRSKKDRKIAGIFGGAGEIYNIDPTLLRLAFIFLGIATGILLFILIYLIGWLIIPEGPVDEKK